MPFSHDFDEVYDKFIAQALRESGYEVRRADDVLSQQNILRDVVNGIAFSHIVVADVTGSNPNVYYELGIAHTLERPVIILTQDMDELPFDLRSYRVIPYDTHFTQIERAKKQLICLATEARVGKIPFGNPVKDFLANNESTSSIIETKMDYDDEGQAGLLDHLIEMQDGFSRLTAIMNEIAKETKDIGQKTQDFNSRMSDITAMRDSDMPRQAHKVIRVFAGDLDSYAKFLSERNDEYRKVLVTAGSSLEIIVEAQRGQQANPKQIREFLGAMTTIESSCQKGKVAFASTANTIRSIPNIERSFNRASQGTVRQLERLVDNIEQTLAVASRAKETASEILSGIHEDEVDS